MGNKKITSKGSICYLFLWMIFAPFLLSGCGHLNEELQSRETFKEANDLFNQGDYSSALNKYRQIGERNPAAGDRVLFEMGIVYSSPRNKQKDYHKALECFSKLTKDYPQSAYRKDSEMMIFNISNVIIKDKTISSMQAQIESMRLETESRGDEINALKKNVEALEQEISGKEREINALQQEIFAVRKVPADRIVIEKKERRLTLLANGKVMKTYRIALGGNPTGPKERQGDNKTPEGTYTIDSRNRDSRFHLSLHISYPNEHDKRRARELGVSPGGDIMIHGIKNGFAWVGDAHADADWTRGCIAVTDEEIEEIDRLVPNGTIVDIRP